MTRPKANIPTPDLILTAAEHIVLRDGVQRLTLEAVAREAKRSMRKRFQAWQRAIECDGIDAARATVVRLAVDGFWLAELLGIWSPGVELRTQVLNQLIQLTQERRQTDQK
jgi:hypothetical protein